MTLKQRQQDYIQTSKWKFGCSLFLLGYIFNDKSFISNTNLLLTEKFGGTTIYDECVLLDHKKKLLIETFERSTNPIKKSTLKEYIEEADSRNIIILLRENVSPSFNDGEKQIDSVINTHRTAIVCSKEIVYINPSSSTDVIISKNECSDYMLEYLIKDIYAIDTFYSINKNQIVIKEFTNEELRHISSSLL